MKVKKAGCVLVNLENNKIALVYRRKQNDYSFSKGHLEEGETLQECAIRETAEEIRRDCRIVSKKEIKILSYTDSIGDETEMYYYLAIDEGTSSNTCLDVHEIKWADVYEVENLLTYQNLKDFWNEIKPLVEELIINNNK